MKINVKKNILLIISILNTIMCCIYLGKDMYLDFNIKIMLLDIGYIILSLFPFLCISILKKFKHLYFLIPFYSLLSFLGVSISTYIFSIIGIIVCFIESEEEKGVLVKVLKRHPIIMSVIITLSGVSFLSIGSVFKFFSELIYGFNMLGELFATILLFFIILVCKKEYLIFKNESSFKEGFFVSLPFIIYSIYLGLSLFAMNYVSGYSFVSIENIVVIILLYLLVGMFEDFLTRGLVLNILLDKFSKTRKGIWVSIFLSSLFFGMVHFVNIFTGASFQGVLIQVITATCIGMYFSAIYLRCGNVWVPALLHGFYDIMVSISAFFVVKEVVDVSSDYGEVISNYSWGNLVVGLIFILLTIFLLRKCKFKDVYSRLNKVDNYKKSDSSLLGYVLMGIGVGIGLFLCISTFVSFFQLRNYAYDFYEEMPDFYLYQYGSVDYDSLSDETKLMVAFSNIDKINENEEKDSLEEIVTYVEDYEVERALRKIFNNDDVKYINFNYSDNSSCSYEKDLQRYKCVTLNDKVSNNNIKVYSNIEKISLDGDNDIELYVYYLVEDLNTNTLYADSSREVVYKYNTSIEDISGGVKYLDSSNNKQFWDNIKNNIGMVPKYKIKLNLNDMGTGLYFVGSEFDYSSIEKVIEKKSISNNLFEYKTSNFSIKLDKDFDIKEFNDFVLVDYEDETVLKIEKVLSDMWFNKYNELSIEEVKLGNYTYYKNANDYLIYADDFYIISIDTSDKNKVLNIISSIEFN